MKPFFSIIIPLYNKEKHIVSTLASVWNQTFTDFEVIVVNDGSTDNSLNKVEVIKDDRLIIHTTKNQGVSEARNFGISNAKADHIVFLDADDLWRNHHLQDLKQLLEEYPNCGLYCKAYYKQVGSTKLTSVFNVIPKDKHWKGIVHDYFTSSCINNIAWTSAVMVPKFVLDDIGTFDPDITMGAGEDTDLWIRIALKYDVVFSNRVSAVHKLDSENRVSNSQTNLRRFIDLDKYEEQAQKMPSLKTYLDLNRFAIAIQYKLADNIRKAEDLIRKIDQNSLNKKQRFLLKQSPSKLRSLVKIKGFLQNFGILLSSFK